MRCSANRAKHKVQKSMYRLKHVVPPEPALAYIVQTRYPPLRLDFESINPRNYFHRGDGGGGSRVIDAYSYELAQPRLGRRSTRGYLRTYIRTMSCTCVCMCVFLGCNSTGDATVDWHIYANSLTLSLFPLFSLSLSSRLSRSLSNSCTHLYSKYTQKLESEGSDSAEIGQRQKVRQEEYQTYVNQKNIVPLTTGRFF